VVGLVTAFLTSFYMFRLWYLTFFGESRYEKIALEEHGAGVHASSTSTLVLEAEPEPHAHTHAYGAHESPWVMLIPLIVLGILSFIGGWIGIPAALGGHNEIARFLDPVFASRGALQGSNSLALALAAVSTVVALSGWLLAHVLYFARPELPARFAAQLRGLYALLANKYWVDEIYGAIIVAPLLFVSRYLLKALIDTGVIDGAAVGSAYAAQGFGAIVQRVQSGNIRSYAGWLALGAAVLLIATYFGFTAHFH
jgi:NADH-quinone oxidoreductase subunit L